MTNHQKWRLLCRDFWSPDAFIDWSWHSLIGAALQRRVYYDNTDYPLYPSMYVILIGPAGVGKGLCTDKLAKIINHFKITKSVRAVQAVVNRQAGKPTGEVTYMFPQAADSTTFESLLVDIGEVSENYVNAAGNDDMQASLYFILDEFTSIFKQHADELIVFLQTAWNGKNYTRRTKHQGHNELKNPLVSLVGGTTPTEFAKLLQKGIVGGGIMGRIVMVYGGRNRCTRKIKLPALDDTQLAAYEDILAWIGGLKKVAQCVKYTPEAEAFLTAWYEDETQVRTNRNQKLDEYYVRKLTHVHKLAMCMHFSEPGYERPVPVETIKRAIASLAEIEPMMHYALMSGGRNELSPVMHQITDYVGRYNEGVTERELLAQFGSDVTHEELRAILQTLQATDLLMYRAGSMRYFSTPK